MFDWFFNIIQEIWWSYVGHPGTNECMLPGKGEIWTSLGRISFYCIIGFILALYIFIVIKGTYNDAKRMGRETKDIIRFKNILRIFFANAIGDGYYSNDSELCNIGIIFGYGIIGIIIYITGGIIICGIIITASIFLVCLPFIIILMCIINKKIISEFNLNQKKARLKKLKNKIFEINNEIKDLSKDIEQIKKCAK